MSSPTDISEKSDKQRIQKLEEQLYDAEYVCRKTKSSHRDIEGKLKTLTAEHEELKKELEKMEEENQDLRSKNLTLQKSNENKTRFMKKLKKKLETNCGFKKSVQTLVEINKGYVEMLKSERDELKVHLEQKEDEAKDSKERIQDLEKLNKEAADSMEILKAEGDNMKTQLEEQSVKLKDYKQEVDRLTVTKEKAINGCISNIDDYQKMLDEWKEDLRRRGSEECSEELNKLEDEWIKACDELVWWCDYKNLSTTLYNTFQAIQGMKTDPPVSEERLVYKKNCLKQLRRSDKKSTIENNGEKGKEWIEMELESKKKYFAKFKKLIKEAEERIKKPQ